MTYARRLGMASVQPPLKRVPKDEWACPHCTDVLNTGGPDQVIHYEKSFDLADIELQYRM